MKIKLQNLNYFLYIGVRSKLLDVISITFLKKNTFSVLIFHGNWYKFHIFRLFAFLEIPLNSRNYDSLKNFYNKTLRLMETELVELFLNIKYF